MGSIFSSVRLFFVPIIFFYMRYLTLTKMSCFKWAICKENSSLVMNKIWCLERRHREWDRIGTTIHLTAPLFS